MDLIASLLSDAEAAIVRRWGSIDACPYRAAIAERINALNQLSPLLKRVKIDKQQCARQFGSIKAQGGDIEALKLKMQQISAQLRALELQQKALESQLQNYFEHDTATHATLPRRFQSEPLPATKCGSITIAEIGPEQAAQWDAYVESNPLAAPYHRYHWRHIIGGAFGHQSFYWAALDEKGSVRGILPIVRLRSFLFGDFGISLPFFNYGGVLADSDAIAGQLFDHAAANAAEHGMHHLEIRATRPLNSWPARTDKVSMILRLPESEEALDAQIGSKIRAQIKRAQQEAPEVKIGHLDLLDAFYRVFAENMRDLGTPVYAKHFFRLILESCPDHSHVVILQLNNKPVAAAFLLGDRDMLEIPWASTLRSVNALNMNMLLYREVLGLGIGRGYRFFDFGRSSKDSGTYRFKRQWGAEPLQHYWHYWLADGGPLPQLKPDSPKFRFLVACWQRLPVAISRLIGPHIVKYLP